MLKGEVLAYQVRPVTPFCLCMLCCTLPAGVGICDKPSLCDVRQTLTSGSPVWNKFESWICVVLRSPYLSCYDRWQEQFLGNMQILNMKAMRLKLVWVFTIIRIGFIGRRPYFPRGAHYSKHILSTKRIRAFIYTYAIELINQQGINYHLCNTHSSHKGRYQEAARVFAKGGQPQLALEMFSDLRQFDEARVWADSVAQRGPEVGDMDGADVESLVQR